MILLRDGNLCYCFNLYSMAHCISAYAKMSKGIAQQLVAQFPEHVSLSNICLELFIAVVGICLKYYYAIISGKDVEFVL